MAHASLLGGELRPRSSRPRATMTPAEFYEEFSPLLQGVEKTKKKNGAEHDRGRGACRRADRAAADEHPCWHRLWIGSARIRRRRAKSRRDARPALARRRRRSSSTWSWSRAGPARPCGGQQASCRTASTSVKKPRTPRVQASPADDGPRPAPGRDRRADRRLKEACEGAIRAITSATGSAS